MDPEDIEYVTGSYISAIEWDAYQDPNATNFAICMAARQTFEARMKDLKFLAIYTAQNAIPLARVPADVWTQTPSVKLVLASMLYAANHAAHLTGRNVMGYIKLFKVLGRLVYCVLDDARPSLRNKPIDEMVRFCMRVSRDRFDMAREVMGVRLVTFTQKHGTFLNVNGESDFPHTDCYPLKPLAAKST